MFEVTGVGSCLLTDRGNETAHLFVPDEEIVTYSSIDERIEKVNYLLNNESVRIEIAKKKKTRTLKDYTVMNRCTEVNEEEWNDGLGTFSNKIFSSRAQK